MNKNKQSISRTFFYTFILISLLATGIPFYLWIQYLVSDMRSHSERVRENYIMSQKMLLKSQVDNIIKTIEVQKADAETKLKKEIKERVDEAYNTCSLIYNKNYSKIPDNELYTMIHDALWYRQWDNGSGYIFAEFLNGVEFINRNNPELEGKNIIDLHDDRGNYLVKDIINIAKTKGEGFATYYWNIPNNPGVLTKKISYVKIFKPLNIVIGSGKYLSQAEQEIKQEVIDHISKITLGDGGYFFAGQWDGLSLSGPSVGQNMYEITDPDGVKIVQELIKASKNGGGFVEYVMPKLEGNRPFPKLSYANAVRDWEWYIGAGKYIDEIEDFIKNSEMENSKAISRAIRNILILYSVIIISGLILIKWFSWKIKENIGIFVAAFKNAEKGMDTIQSEKISFTEFFEIAQSANRMFEHKKKADKDLEETRGKFKEVIENAHIPIMITDSLSKIEYLNSEFTKVFGYSREDIPDIDIWINSACDNKIQKVKDENYCKNIFTDFSFISKAYDIDIYCKDKTEIKTVEVTKSVIGDRCIFTLIDISERIKTEKEKKLFEQQKHRYQKMEAIGLMAGGVAHDLNNILSGIIGYPEVILSDMDKNDPLYAPLLQIKESAFRASAVVADLITVARGVASKKEAADLNELINDFLKSPEFQKISSSYPDIDVKTDLDPDLQPVSCSTIHIKKVLMNLVTNAFEAISLKGLINISTKSVFFDKVLKAHSSMSTGAYLLLKISDNGKGIASEDLERIFEPFYTKKVMGRSGTGLGLSIVWNTVLDHNGFLDVESSPMGTTFNIYLPATSSSLKSVNEVPLEAVKGNGEFVLVVDDEENQRLIARALLERLNYRVYAVSSGEEAVEYLAENTADIIVLDMVMDPGMSGYETLKKIKENNNKQKAVIASGFTETSELDKTIALGDCDFINKPYSLAILGSALKKILASN